MLSICNVKNAAHAESYFTKEDYYIGKNRTGASQWWGTGARELGLEGRVDTETFGRLARGELPDGTELPCKKGGQRRAATDLTFSAPKSVSIEALVHGRTDVLAAHTTAVKQGLQYLEERATNVRTSSGGKVQRCSSNTLVVAMFEHHTSRALDPQLHTHCLALNATKTPDGKWRALVNDDFYSHKMAAGMVYRAQLARGLKELGYELHQTHADGRFELADCSTEHMKTFSKRRKEILQALDGELGDKLRDLGLDGAEAAKKANLGTRKVKREVDPELLRALWQQQGRQQSMQPARRLQERPAWGAEHGTEQIAQQAVRWAIDHLSERCAVWQERDVLRCALSRRLTEVTQADIETCFAKMRNAGELVVVGGPRTGQALYTTREMIELEGRAVRTMHAGRERFGTICPTELVDDKLEAYGLTAGQTRAAQLILLNNDMVVGVQGYAGTGKTTMLRAVRDLAEEVGYTVRGMGVSGTAAKELQHGAGVSSSTVAAHLLKHRVDGSAKRELWLVDEASFLGSRDAVRLLESARRAGARMVLLGDRDQLPAIEAGQPFAQLCRRGMRTAVMSEIVRTQDETLKNAVYKTIDKKRMSEQLQVQAAQEIVRSLDKSVVVETSAEKRHQAIAQTYLDGDRSSTLVLTATHKERQDLNRRIRHGLIADGTLGQRAADATVLVSRDLTTAQLRVPATYEPGDVVRVGRRGGYKSLGLEQGTCATVKGRDAAERVVLATEQGRAVAWDPSRAHCVEVYREESRELRAGDQIRWTRTDKDLGRGNGAGAVVVRVDREAKAAVVRMKDGRSQTLDLASEKHWEHGYACTTHAAQGSTSDKVIAHLNTRNASLVGHESWYVAISRARHQAQVFTDDVDKLPEAITHDMRQPSALEMLEDHEGQRQEQRPQEQQRGATQEALSTPEKDARRDHEGAEKRPGLGDRLKAIKRSVNLVQFAVSQGYVVNKKKSTQRSIVLDRDEDKIIVSRGNDGTWIYFSVREAQDKGTIVDFAQRRTDAEIGVLADKLELWQRERGDDGGELEIALGPARKSPTDIQAELSKMQPLESLLYLDLRRLHSEDLTDARFSGRLFRDAKYNAIFPHYDAAERVVGYERKASDFKGFSPGGTRGVWLSNRREADNRLVLTEAVLDALSYHKMYGDEQTRYVSTGGSIGPKQIECIGKALEELPQGAQVVLGFDNDEAGEKYSEQVRKLVPPRLSVERQIPSLGKDWNAELEAKHELDRDRSV
jgi:conjugative relaxase-like TrwC/TraI family protein